MERKRSVRRRQKPPCERAKDHCRAFTAFMFSNVGITFLVVLYTIAGEYKWASKTWSTRIKFGRRRKSEARNLILSDSSSLALRNKLLMYHLLSFVLISFSSVHRMPLCCSLSLIPLLLHFNRLCHRRKKVHLCLCISKVARLLNAKRLPIRSATKRPTGCGIFRAATTMCSIKQILLERKSHYVIITRKKALSLSLSLFTACNGAMKCGSGFRLVFSFWIIPIVSQEEKLKIDFH